MTERLILLEGTSLALERDRLKDNIFAHPETELGVDAESRYRIAGWLESVDSQDFEHHDYWNRDFLDLRLLGELKTSSPNEIELLEEGLEAICGSGTFNHSLLLENERLRREILSYAVVEGDIYVVRFSGRNSDAEEYVRENEGRTEFINDIQKGHHQEMIEKSKVGWSRSLALLVSGQVQSVDVDGTYLVLDGMRVEIPGSGLRTHLDFYGDSVEEREVFKAGEASLHRKSLSPFSSTGAFGGNYSNGPRITLG